MKNFIFAMCGFLMMSLVSLSVQASSVESPKCEYVNPSVDVGLPDIQFITLETAPADCVVLTMTHPMFLVANNPAMMCSIKEGMAIQGAPIPGTGDEYWQEVCKCRCDDNTTKEFSSDNGSVYRPNYHVVCEKRITVKAGDEVRCMDGDGVRGQGEVYTVKSTNYFNYSELWM